MNSSEIRLEALNKAIEIANRSTIISDRNPDKILELAMKIEAYLTNTGK